MQLAFPEAKVVMLARTHSYHNLIKFMGFAGDVVAREARPFWFEGVWLLMEDYREIWKEAWLNQEYNMVGAIDNVTNCSKVWN